MKYDNNIFTFIIKIFSIQNIFQFILSVYVIFEVVFFYEHTAGCYSCYSPISFIIVLFRCCLLFPFCYYVFLIITYYIAPNYGIVCFIFMSCFFFFFYHQDKSLFSYNSDWHVIVVYQIKK